MDEEQEESDEGLRGGDEGAVLGGDMYWTVGEDDGAGSWGVLEEGFGESMDGLLLVEEEAMKELGKSFGEDEGMSFCLEWREAL